MQQYKQNWMTKLIMMALLTAVLIACQNNTPAAQEEHAAETAAEGHSSPEITLEPRAELEISSPIPLDASIDKTKEIGFVYEAFLSPEQEGGDEQETPSLVPDIFKSTTASVDRVLRPSRGHGVLAFTNDLSTAYAFIAVEEVKLDEIVMFHIHCGRPGQLGPIIIDFSLRGDLTQYWADGVLTMELTNEDLVAAANHGEGLVSAFTAGCPIMLAIPTDKVKTIAGLQYIAEEGDLYFNLHTTGQTFFGDIRGQLQRVD